MRAPRSIAQATLNRLLARVGTGLADTAAGLAVLAQDAPSRLREELLLFWDEVEREAERIERDASAGDDGSTAAASPPASRAASDPQEMIDSLRAQVADLSRRLDEKADGAR